MVDYSEYHPDWKDVIRPSILKRDQYKCRHCGVRHKSIVYKLSNGAYHECDSFEHQWAIANNKKPFILYLQIAHVDHDKSNNDPGNLLALCPRCHGKFDKSHKQFMRKVYQSKMPQTDKTLKVGVAGYEAQTLSEIIHAVQDLTGVKISTSAANQLLSIVKNSTNE
jgi:5-methylcytosine-specific restriction endonuclease McrA